MNKPFKFFLLVLVIIILLILVAYFLNFFSKYGLCKPGMKFFEGPFNEKFCYTPSGYGGQPCNKQTDCGTASCVLIDENKIDDGGICIDIVRGCSIQIDKLGELGSMICVD